MGMICRMDDAGLPRGLACRRNGRKAAGGPGRQITSPPPARTPRITAFRCLPIETETAERFRRTGLDDRGQPLLRRVLQTAGSPCRYCLQPGKPGEVMLLGSYDLPHPQGV